MRKRWILSGLSPKGKTFKAEVIADSEAGARANGSCAREWYASDRRGRAIRK